MFYVYKIENKLNNMVYIGVTRKNILARFKEHKRNARKRRTRLYDAFNADGIENFAISLVELCNNDALIEIKEKYYIALYDSMNPARGYNMTCGGNGTAGYVFSEEAKEKISKAGIGRTVSDHTRRCISNANKGKKLSEDIKRKISLSRLGKYTGIENPFYGKKHTEETKKKIIQSRKKHGYLRAIKGTNLKTSDVVIFDSVADASRYCEQFHNGNHTTMMSHIISSIVGRYDCKSAYGYKWEYIEKSNDYPDRE